jgi:heterodisulfide reductase subunit A
MVEERIQAVVAHPRIRVWTETVVNNLEQNGKFEVELASRPRFIDPDRCTACGACLEVCPAPGAVNRSFSGHNRPAVALNQSDCLFFKDGSCRKCVQACPEGAVDLEQAPSTQHTTAAAVVMATGYSAFSPENKPYGYGRFADVVTSLQLENMLRTDHQVKRPSDGHPPDRLAFIQCVGSRDATLNHLWCSKVCCASALRMARVIQARRAETEVTFFYIDVQTFGREFESVYAGLRKTVRMKRAIPADIVETADGGLEVTYYDNDSGQSAEEVFDMVVLSVGMTPRANVSEVAAPLGVELADSGFALASDQSPANRNGVFSTGSACGPMSIADAIADGGRAAWQAADYLSRAE